MATWSMSNILGNAVEVIESYEKNNMITTIKSYYDSIEFLFDSMGEELPMLSLNTKNSYSRIDILTQKDNISDITFKGKTIERIIWPRDLPGFARDSLLFNLNKGLTTWEDDGWSLINKQILVKGPLSNKRVK